MKLEHSDQNLFEGTTGKAALPSETHKYLLIPKLSYRDFLILFSRSYASQPLCIDNEIHLKENQPYEPNESEFFFLDVFFNLKEIDSFYSELYDDFSSTLLTHASRTNARMNKGNRAVFVTDIIGDNHPNYGRILKCKLVISKNVFYNDFRVSLNYPFSEEETAYEIEQIFNNVKNEWDSTLKIEISLSNPSF